MYNIQHIFMYRIQYSSYRNLNISIDTDGKYIKKDGLRPTHTLIHPWTNNGKKIPVSEDLCQKLKSVVNTEFYKY